MKFTGMLHALTAVALMAGTFHTALAQPASEPAAFAGPDRSDRLLANAKKEGSLTLYTTTPGEYMRLLTDGFEKKYGIKVNVWRGLSEQVLQRVLAESRGNKNTVDVVQNLSVSMEALHREGLLQPIKSPVLKDLIAEAVPAHQGWAPSMHYVYVQAYNTSKIKKEELPKTYGDLLDPKWKDKLAIEAGDYDWFFDIMKDMGEQQGRALFCGLLNNGMSVRTGHALLTNLVASGEVPLALTVYQYSPQQAKQKGAPIDWFAIEPAIAITDGIGVTKKAPHPNAAILFYDYMLSEDGQNTLAKIGYVPASTKVESPIKGTRLKRLNAASLLDEGEQSRAMFEDVIINKRACK
jgi:iron(III) transport system substrate-binding protein